MSDRPKPNEVPEAEFALLHKGTNAIAVSWDGAAIFETVAEAAEWIDTYGNYPNHRLARVRVEIVEDDVPMP